jgi:hypothetical protein
VSTCSTTRADREAAYSITGPARDGETRRRQGMEVANRRRQEAEATMPKYGEAAQKRVASAMRRRKKGTLKSSSGQKVTSRKQAIAIGLSEARSKGGKVPARKTGGKKKK